MSKRNVIYSLSMSLDGFVEGPNHELDWVIVDEEFHTFANERERAIGVQLYGRRMYEIMADYWPTVDEDSSVTAYEIEFARIWREMPKIVFSRTLERVEWNARLVRDNIADEVLRLKEQPGKDMGIGGATIAAAFMQLGLIDRYQIYVQPVILGGGTPMFPLPTATQNLRLVETHTFESGVIFLHYQRADEGS